MRPLPPLPWWSLHHHPAARIVVTTTTTTVTVNHHHRSICTLIRVTGRYCWKIITCCTCARRTTRPFRRDRLHWPDPYRSICSTGSSIWTSRPIHPHTKSFRGSNAYCVSNGPDIPVRWIPKWRDVWLCVWIGPPVWSRPNRVLGRNTLECCDSIVHWRIPNCCTGPSKRPSAGRCSNVHRSSRRWNDNYGSGRFMIPNWLNTIHNGNWAFFGSSVKPGPMSGPFASTPVCSWGPGDICKNCAGSKVGYWVKVIIWYHCMIY